MPAPPGRAGIRRPKRGHRSAVLARLLLDVR